MTASASASEPNTQTPSTRDDQQRHRRQTLNACSIAHALHDGLVDMLYALLPALAQTLGLSLGQVGLLRAANNLAAASFQLPAGLLAERIGAQRLLIAGTVLAGAAFLGLLLVDSYTPLLIGFFIAGCGSAVQHPLSSSLLTRAFPAETRARALGAYNTFGDVGKFGFLGVTMLILAVGLSWHWPVALFGACALGVAIAIHILLRGVRDLQQTANAAAPGDASATRPKATGWGIKNRAGFAALGMVVSLDTACRTGFLTFIAFLMIDKGVAIEWAGAAVLVTIFGGMLGKYACGLLAERIGYVRAIALTELATAVGIVIVILLPGYAAFATLPFLGIVLNGTSSVSYAVVSELVDDNRHDRAYGLIYTIGSACGVLSPVLFGLLADKHGIPMAMAGVALLVMLTVPLLPAMRRALNKKTAQT